MARQSPGDERTRWNLLRRNSVCVDSFSAQGMMGRIGGLKALGLLLALMVSASSCTTHPAFKEDKRIKIVSPATRSTVTLPFDIRWTVTDFQVTGPNGKRDKNAGYFAVFVDRSPVAPGRDLRWFARDDQPCLKTPGCPDEAYLNQRNIYTTQVTVFKITAIRDSRPLERPKAKDSHEVSIVLLNGAGQRIGEAAFAVEFIVARKITGR